MPSSKKAWEIHFVCWVAMCMANKRRFNYQEKENSGRGGSQPCLHSSPRVSNLTWIKWKYHFLPTFPFPSVLVPPHPSGGAILWGRGWQGEVSSKLSGEQRENCAMKLNSRWPGIEIKDPKQKVSSWSKWGWGLLSKGPRCLLR